MNWKTIWNILSDIIAIILVCWCIGTACSFLFLLLHPFIPLFSKIKEKLLYSRPWLFILNPKTRAEVKQIYSLAKDGHPDKQFRIYQIFAKSEKEFALTFLRSAAALDHTEALLEGCDHHSKILDTLIPTADIKPWIDELWEELLKWKVQLAEKGMTDQQYEAAQLYANHFNDMRYAFHWYQKAAEQGHVASMLEIGKMYYSGTYVSRDLNKAIHYFEPAANAGNREAAKLMQDIRMDLEAFSN